MTQIHKFVLAGIGRVLDVEMCEDTHLVSVQAQRNMIYMWGIVPKLDKPKVVRKFIAVGTGWDIDFKNGSFYGTVQIDQFVWHVFEVLP